MLSQFQMSDRAGKKDCALVGTITPAFTEDATAGALVGNIKNSSSEGKLVAVAVVINVPGTLLCCRPLLSRTAQPDCILRETGALLSLGILRRTSNRLRQLVDLVGVATVAGWVDCHRGQIGSGAEDFSARQARSLVS